jgi:hypothetical protein
MEGCQRSVYVSGDTVRKRPTKCLEGRLEYSHSSPYLGTKLEIFQLPSFLRTQLLFIPSPSCLPQKCCPARYLSFPTPVCLVILTQVP